LDINVLKLLVVSMSKCNTLSNVDGSV